MQTNKLKKIYFAGGGTAGPTMPLVAIASSLTQDQFNVEFLLSTTRFDKFFADRNPDLKISFITEAKLDRHLSVSSLLLPFSLLRAFLQVFVLFWKSRPAAVVGAGGFVSVPAVLIGKLFGARVLVHQQDIEVGLANRICARFADVVTVSLEPSVEYFSKSLSQLTLNEDLERVHLTGNPVRLIKGSQTRESAYHNLGLDPKYPTILITTGSSGSLVVNDFIASNLSVLCESFNVLHIIGSESRLSKSFAHARYKSFEVVDGMLDLYLAADVVICRAGLSTISELSYLSKLSVVIPMPNSHQESNALYLHQSKAAIVLDQSDLATLDLTAMLKFYLHKPNLIQAAKQSISSIMPKDSAKKIATLLEKLISHARHK